MAGTTKTKAERSTLGRPTPLWVISLFVSLTETVLSVAVIQTTGLVQLILTLFVIIFAILVAGAFFVILWFRSWVFYSPGEYGNVDPEKYVDAVAHAQARITNVTTITADVKEEITPVGNPDQMQLLFKVVGPSWQKSTKAMEAGTGCIVQVSTQLLNLDVSTSVAEGVVFVPKVRIAKDGDGKGRHLTSVEDGK
jgi:hypothetical protein